MKYNITQEDKDLLLQPSLEYKYRLFIVDKDKNILDEIQGISSTGSYNIDSESDIRRTNSFSLLLDNCYRDKSLEKRLFLWIGYNFQIQIGILSLRNNDYKWYDCGYYLITEANTSYNATDNSLSLNLSDWYSKFDGTRNGQIGGAPTILIPNEDEEGNPITIKDATEGVLKDNGISDYIVDDIGEFYGMPQNNPDYEQYRKDNPLWNQLPYDLEYDVGCYISEIFEEIKNLYPNCQMYFDIYGNLCFNLIPSCEYEPIVLDNDFLQKILLADNTENVSYDIGNIKNVTEVFGQSYEIDRYSTSVTNSTNIYTATLEDYTRYSSGDMIAFTPNISNIENMKFRINSLAAIPIYYEYTSEYIDAGLLEANKTYVLQIKRSGTDFVAYYLGQYQPHALCVLTNDENDSVYTKSYFAQKYNCDEQNVVLRVENENPFSVQKLGEILDVKTGEEFENILSDSVAMENAIYYNRQSSSVYDTVEISTKMIPFLDVNEKVEYKKQQEEESKYYIIKSINNDTESLTSQITMYRFYPLYYK